MAKERLKTIIADKSFKTGHFTLASGATSDYLFDLKPTVLDPEGSNLVADLMIAWLAEERADAIGGLELGACPIVSAICVKSFNHKALIYPLKTFYVRKTQKERGTKKRIEGAVLYQSDKVVMVEDVTTTGGSVMDAIYAVQQEGVEVKTVFSIVDRLEGAQENLAKQGIKLKSIFTKHDFGIS